MDLSSFVFDLPNDLIATRPSKPRGSSSLLVVDRKSEEINITKFKNIINYIADGDLLIFNDTKVDSVLLFTKDEKNNSREMLLVREIDQRTWTVLTKNPKNTRISFSNGAEGYLKKINEEWHIVFDCESREVIRECGEMPIPPYIGRNPDDFDKIDYQTVYAKKSGSIAAPTAGLHFSNELITSMEENGVDIDYLTLHVGLGTFLPVKEKDITKHKMHQESFFIHRELIEKIKKNKKEKKRIISVGTTTLRAIESHQSDNDYANKWVETDLFIKDGFQFNFVNGLITNFHLPKSTLLILVSAFLGYELTMECYKLAIKERLNFYSYGDAMLII
jgi:S-adenosylmethionine:tRNA ribosyltransferase-isomerase